MTRPRRNDYYSSLSAPFCKCFYYSVRTTVSKLASLPLLLRSHVVKLHCKFISFHTPSSPLVGDKIHILHLAARFVNVLAYLCQLNFVQSCIIHGLTLKEYGGRRYYTIISPVFRHDEPWFAIGSMKNPNYSVILFALLSIQRHAPLRTFVRNEHIDASNMVLVLQQIGGLVKLKCYF